MPNTLVLKRDKKGVRYVVINKKKYQIKSKLPSDELILIFDRLLRRIEKKQVNKGKGFTSRRAVNAKFSTPKDRTVVAPEIFKKKVEEQLGTLITLKAIESSNLKPSGYENTGSGKPKNQVTDGITINTGNQNPNSLNEIKEIKKQITLLAQAGNQVNRDVQEQIASLKKKRIQEVRNIKVLSPYYDLLKQLGFNVPDIIPHIPADKTNLNDKLRREIEKNEAVLAIMGVKTDNADGKKRALQKLIDELNEANPGNVNEQPPQQEQEQEQEPEQDGEGNCESVTSQGLSNIEITELMKQANIPGFLGVFSISNITDLIHGSKNNFSFIMNTEPFPKMGHWVAVILLDDVLEYYDSYGDEPSEEFLKSIRKILSGRSMIQFKINRIKHQENDSSRCGWHAMSFLINRLKKGQTFKEATGFDELLKLLPDSSKARERVIKQMEKKFKDFGTL